MRITSLYLNLDVEDCTACGQTHYAAYFNRVNNTERLFQTFCPGTSKQIYVLLSAVDA